MGTMSGCFSWTQAYSMPWKQASWTSLRSSFLHSSKQSPPTTMWPLRPVHSLVRALNEGAMICTRTEGTSTKMLLDMPTLIGSLGDCRSAAGAGPWRERGRGPNMRVRQSVAS